MTTQSLGSVDIASEVLTQITNDPEVWGTLLPLVDGVPKVDLIENFYLFGRGVDCNVIFGPDFFKHERFYKAVSSHHFSIERDAENHVFITDLSMNGTYVNAEKVPRNVKRALSGNEEITIVLQNSRFYMFIKLGGPDDGDHTEIKKDFVLSKTIGKGSYGEVKLAFRKRDCKKFAVKVLLKHVFGCENAVSKSSFTIEVDILKRISHPCIISIENVIDTNTSLYIVLEYVGGGELFDRIVAQSYLEESVSKLLFYQLALAVQYLHQQQITHRDIKPENILLCDPLSNETLIKVTDFGLSKFLGSTSVMKTYCGTPNYLAPEVLASAGVGNYTKSIDIWSMGVVLYACLCGSFPFPEEENSNLADAIMKGSYEFSSDIWDSVSSDAKDLISRMMVVNPNDRLTCDEILEHSWLKDRDMQIKAHDLMGLNETVKRRKIE